MPSLPRNSDVADALDELADVSEVLGEQGFRVLAYRRAATRVRETAASIAELALAGRAKELPGIGGTIAGKIVELTETGRMSALEKRRAEVPGEVTQFLPGAIIGGGTLAILVATVYRTSWRIGPGRPPAPTTREIGQQFLGPYLLPFEAASILLLVALIGAAMIVRRRREA